MTTQKSGNSQEDGRADFLVLNEEAAARLAALIDSTDDAVIAKNLDGWITAWNAAAERMFGYTADEAIGKNITMIIPEDRRSEEDMVVSRILAGESVTHFETIRVAKDGHPVEVSITVAPIRDHSGRIVGASKIARDIGGRVQAEEARARLAAIVESSDDAIISKTLDGVIRSWNQAAEKIFGYTSQEAIGHPVTLIIPVERHSEEDEVLRKLRRGERVDHFDTVRVRKDGRRLDVSLTISPLFNSAGQIIGASKIARDITDQKRMERERAALLSEAQAANRAKDEFLAMLGHELRNPLAAISAAVQAQGLASALPDIQRPREVIGRQLEKLAQLVDDLLDAAQVQAGKIRLQLARLRLADLLRTSSETVATQDHAIDIECDEEVLISGDLTRLQQVFHNLIVNAVQYSPPDKRIGIRGYGDGDFAVVEITDEGMGIPADTLPRIFDMFVQGQRSADRMQSGLGIGLTLARKLVELHGGTLVASSGGLGHGSVFTVRLPRLPAEVSPAPAATPTVTRRVLVVEDNDDTREMFRMVLELKGHEVFEAADGAEAVKVALRERPEIAFIDIGLPVMDGYEVAREIRRNLGSEILLIAVTGYGQPEDEACALRAGFDEHAVKPLSPPRLSEILRRKL